MDGAALPESMRMIHVGGDEDVAGFAAGDAPAEKPGCAEDGVDGDPVRRGKFLRGAAERGAEAACGDEPELRCQIYDPCPAFG